MSEFPEKRELDGICLRIQEPSGKWDNRCLTDLPWEQVEAWIRRDDRDNVADFAISVAQHLHERLRNIADQLDIFCGSEAE